MRPGFLISQFSQFSRSSQDEKTRLYTWRLRSPKNENPTQILPEFFFSGRRNGLDFAYLLYVYLFECFGDIFLLCMRYFLKGISSLFQKKSSFFLPLFFFPSFYFPFFSSFFLLFFAARAIFRVLGILLRPGVLISQFSRSKKVLYSSWDLLKSALQQLGPREKRFTAAGTS